MIQNYVRKIEGIIYYRNTNEKVSVYIALKTSITRIFAILFINKPRYYFWTIWDKLVKCVLECVLAMKTIYKTVFQSVTYFQNGCGLFLSKPLARNHSYGLHTHLLNVIL